MTATTLLQALSGGGFSTFLIPLALMFGIMYLMVILPQQRQRKKTQAMLAALKTGDKVITGSGIYGTISGIDRSEEHTSELQSRRDLVCRLLLEKKKSASLHVPHPPSSLSIPRQSSSHSPSIIDDAL